MKTKLTSTALMTLLILASANVFAASSTVNYVGTDSSGKPCGVQLTINDQNASAAFRYTKNNGIGDGYGFSATSDLREALDQGRNPIVISEGGIGGAKLKLSFNEDGTVDASYSNLVLISAKCESMKQVR